ncbi:MAG TPA: hypothetical protein VMV92_39885 [Streptosporangiaceae bacterium]|nr:hypothetical protein [Streptosporangiaceae bacterium]
MTTNGSSVPAARLATFAGDSEWGSPLRPDEATIADKMLSMVAAMAAEIRN